MKLRPPRLGMKRPRKDPHFVALGRLGGAATKGISSRRKAAASRANGRKGGRPRTK